MTRRKFLTLTAGTSCGWAVGTAAYSFLETEQERVMRMPIQIPNLPPAFAGTTIAFLSDIHHSQVVPRAYLERVVARTNDLKPDFILLGGDYVTAGPKYQPLRGRHYIDPCFEILKELRAPGGQFGVTGNHDTWAGLDLIHAGMRRAGICDLTNRGGWLERHGGRLWLCGLGDLATQNQDLPAALVQTTPDDAVLLLTHNPDFAQYVRDPRVGHVLSGHTHGGQIVLPFIGAPLVPSGFGQKYRYGLVQAPRTKIYITSGIGVLPFPFRFNCPPEIALLTLA